jgi:hypothetical protein
MRYQYSTDYRGFEVLGNIVDGGWEGDPDVPGGTRHLGPEVVGFEIRLDGRDVTAMLTIEAIEECLDALVEASCV